jgi:hypothetical protein
MSSKIESINELQARRVLAMGEKFLCSLNFDHSSDNLAAKNLVHLDLFSESIHYLLNSEYSNENVRQRLREMNDRIGSEKSKIIQRQKSSTVKIEDITFATQITSEENPASLKEQDNQSAEKIQQLMLEQKEIHQKELVEEKRRKDELLTDLMTMTGVLKQTTLTIHQSVRNQNIVS